MVDSSIYLVTEDIALRSGLINSRYRVADGRFILNRKDLARIRMTSDEMINGFQGVERISHDEALLLIGKNKHTMGADPQKETLRDSNVRVQQQDVVQEVVAEEKEAQTIVEMKEEVSKPIASSTATTNKKSRKKEVKK